MKHLAITLLVAACGTTNGASAARDAALVDIATDATPDAALDVTQSGTRIKIKTLVTADGAHFVTGAYDSQLGQDCAFGMADDGMMRCLPTKVAVADRSFFSDSLCTSPAAVVYDCEPTPAYLVKPLPSTSCPTPVAGPSYYDLGATSRTAYVSTGGTGCAMTGSAADHAYYALGTMIPASTFASGTPMVE